MHINPPINFTLLIDDDKVINFYNEKIVNKHQDFINVVAVNSGMKALEYLNNAILGLTKKPNLIFLDINMPAMNGWEFIEEYDKLDKAFTSSIKIILLTTSNNPDDFERYKTIDLLEDFINKPLSDSLLTNLIESHYKEKTI
ncbi:two-component system response regulator [Olleya sp. HaHaR_3_96]|uniref:response regulator n=1 Tax=Olleya sp. HaHaR_3_96 TaxID=2745560 RepID=UPI001C4F7BD1|nr:response regulator [Olleya sp. HaHaR_3_96]QXP59267.1 response regulator [Olleya sp. HaHaR_3_96]